MEENEVFVYIERGDIVTYRQRGEYKQMGL